MRGPDLPFPLSTAAITRAEQALGVSFPPDYIAHIRAANGGSLEAFGESWELIPILDDSTPKRLARTCNDIVRETHSFREWRTFPARAVAIALDGCGNALILLPHPTEPTALTEAIYDWCHDSGKLTFIAASLSELVKHPAP